MKLEIFDHTQGSTSSGSQYRAITINRRDGKITISRQAVSELNLTAEHSIIFAKDSDSKCDWYFAIKEADPSGIPVREFRHGGKGNPSLGLRCRYLTNTILDSIKAKSSATILIAREPTSVNGQEWYQLIMTKPIRIN